MPPVLERLQPVVSRVTFALLSTIIVVTFSEKMYWYVTGYEVFFLWMAYFLPTFMFLTVVDFFRVQRPAPLFLAAAVFGFLVEGMLAPVLYEGGPFGWFSISYTPLAWHAPLSIIFGWFLLRRWLVNRQLGRVMLGSVAVGLFWGLWSLAWWLPENANDPALLADGARLGQWPVWEYALHAFVFTGLVVLAHWLLGRGGWQPRFEPTWIELVIVGLLLAGFFAATVLPLYGEWTTLKLGGVLTAALLPLWLARDHMHAGSYLQSLDGPVRPFDALLILLMPATAVGVYALATWLQPSVDLLYIITTWGPVLATAYGGLAVFFLAIYLTARLRES